MPKDNTPLWSVMIPTWNPKKEHLVQSLQSVLMQDQGTDKMQIAVVDDASTEVDVESIVKEVSRNRIEFYQNSYNYGIGGGWNKCINLAKGELIHILHQDDYVRKGFYETLKPGLESSDEIGAAFTRTIYMDYKGNWSSISRLVGENYGIIKNYLNRVNEIQIVPSSTVIKKQVYKDLGLYNTDLVYSLDREMMTRIGTKYRVWFDSRPLLCYRVNIDSQTAKLKETASHFLDFYEMTKIIENYLPKESRTDTITSMRYNLFSRAVDELYESWKEKEQGKIDTLKPFLIQHCPKPFFAKRIIKALMIDILKGRLI